MDLTLHKFDLPLRHTFTIAYKSTRVQRSLIVELGQRGLRGFGEATSNEYYGATIEDMAAALERARPQIESCELDDPVQFWEQMQAPLADQPFAQCALDVAAHDLWGKLRGQPVWKLWGLGLDNLPVTDYTIGIDEIDVMVAKLNEFPDWPIYKIKLGTGDDVEIVRRLREHTEATFRVDANCGWTAGQAIAYSVALKELGV